MRRKIIDRKKRIDVIGIMVVCKNVGKRDGVGQGGDGMERRRMRKMCGDWERSTQSSDCTASSSRWYDD